MGLGILGEGKLVARRGQHAEVYGVNEQLTRGPDLQICQLATESPLAELQGQAWPDPVGGQHGAPSVARIADAVVFKLPVPDPLAPDEFELQGLATGERHLAAAVIDGRVITGIGASAHHLALQRSPARQPHLFDPLAVGGLYLHQGMLPQPLE